MDFSTEKLSDDFHKRMNEVLDQGDYKSEVINKIIDLLDNNLLKIEELRKEDPNNFILKENENYILMYLGHLVMIKKFKLA